MTQLDLFAKPPPLTARDLTFPLERKADGWWLTKIPLDDCPEMGPYKIRDEAEEARRGLRRWFADAAALGIV